ncbi:hypothetical protein PC121_g14123 [Phytophthora cactorum]|nr:hypothetical protein PC120_g12657 [Phytophthora cactorum]KAG3059021.1 hypothetical protein PC121_g14123 [Phytophthora cactorum]KAG4053086.1 hypothetical protein PC123_g11738 [Phytophthora cactorum]
MLLYFWRQVLHEINVYAVAYEINISQPLTINELMKFLGIMFFMTLNKKGEYANYWASKTVPEFQCDTYYARKTTLQLGSGPTKLAQETGDKYIVVGRNVALDEASVTCRSRQGRHMIVFNPSKPTGKYHCRLYMVAALLL